VLALRTARAVLVRTHGDPDECVLAAHVLRSDPWRLIEMLFLLLLIVLILAVIPSWPYSRGWGYYPSGGLGLVLLVVVLLLLMGRI
jgi:Protein of unknown function (DUF3309)